MARARRERRFPSPRRGRARLGARLGAFLGTDAAAARQSLTALAVSSGGDLLAGLTLGSITHTLDKLPGLLVMVPAAIGMRGNVFGALGSRLGTAIHAGSFRLSGRRDTVVGQNVVAAAVLTLSTSVALAVLAKAVAVAFGVAQTISVVDYLVISIVGAVLSSAIVLVVTLAVAAKAAKKGWDLDNVAAPLVTAAGDVVTLPALFAATFLVGIGWFSPLVAVTAAGLSLSALVNGLRSPLPVLRRVVRESLPVLLVAGLVDVLAGVTIEKRLESFLSFPALLVLVPPFLEDSGALGGILSSRLSSKLHLGLLAPAGLPSRVARREFLLTLLYAGPVFVLLAVSAELAAAVAGLPSPGLGPMLAISLLGGMVATAMAMLVAYYGAIGAWRLGLDPDNHGIPLITSSMDLIGAFALILAIVAVIGPN